MEKILTLFLTLILVSQFFAQKDQYEIVTKRNKQGVKSNTSEQWLIPMGKHKIVEPHENLYLKINTKNKTIQGFYRDEYYDKMTGVGSKQFFGEPYMMRDVFSFEDGYIDIPRHSFTRPRYNVSSNGIVGPGAGYFEGFLFVAACSDNSGLFNVDISRKKNLEMHFTDVEYRIINNKLLIGLAEMVQYDPVYDISHVVNQIDVYSFANGEFKKEKSITKAEQEQFDLYLNHLRGYSYDPISPPTKVDYQELLNSDFKKDSAERYKLILETEAGVLFANPNEKFFLSFEGEWSKIDNDYFDKGLYEAEGTSFFSIESNGVLDLIDNHIFDRDYNVLDKYGEYVYDENGDVVYQEVEDVQKGGVWSWEKLAWIVPNEYLNVIFIGNKIVAKKVRFTKDEENEYRLVSTPVIDIYDLEGKVLASMTNPSEMKVLESIYSNCEVEKIEGTYTMYQVTRGKNFGIVDFSLDFLSGYEVSSLDEGVIPYSYNAMSNSFITQKGTDFYINEYDVEVGVTTRLLEGKYAGLFNVIDEYGGSGFQFVSTDNMNAYDNPVSGVWRISQNEAIVYNNKSAQVFSYYNEYGDAIYNYDEPGGLLYGYYYDSKGDSQSGLWDVNTRTWKIQPEYFSIVPSSSGYAAVRREELVNGTIQKDDYGQDILLTKKENAIRDTFFLDLFGKDLNPIQSGLDPNSFLDSPDNIKFFLDIEDLGNCIHYPMLVDSVNMIHDTYTYNWYEQGDGYAIIVPNTFTFRPWIVTENMDWLHQSYGNLYGLRGDTLIITFESGHRPSAQVKVGESFQIKDSEQGVAIFSEDEKWFIREKDGKIETLTYREEHLGEINTVISKDADEIHVESMNRDMIYFFQMDTWDPYESYVNVKHRNDFVWKHNGQKWQVALNANHIEKLPFGYLVDSTFITEVVSDVDYAGPGLNLEEINGGICFLNHSFEKIDLPMSSYYSWAPIEERNDLFIVNYADGYRFELTAIISEDGRIAVEACNYSIENNVLTYTLCDLEGFGMVRYDENGEEVTLTIDLE